MYNSSNALRDRIRVALPTMGIDSITRYIEMIPESWAEVFGEDTKLGEPIWDDSLLVLNCHILHKGRKLPIKMSFDDVLGFISVRERGAVVAEKFEAGTLSSADLEEELRAALSLGDG